MKEESKPFEDAGLRIVAVRLIDTLSDEIVRFKPILDKDFVNFITMSLSMTKVSLQKEEITQDDVLMAHRKFALAKEPIVQLRLELLEVTEDTKVILVVFALHELYNSIGKLIDSLYAYSHVNDNITLDGLEFREALARHLQKLFGV